MNTVALQHTHTDFSLNVVGFFYSLFVVISPDAALHVLHFFSILIRTFDGSGNEFGYIVNVIHTNAYTYASQRAI